MSLFRKNIAKMAGYVPGEQPKEPGYTKLNTNENPYPPSPKVGEAVSAAAEDLRLYPDPSASALRARLGEIYNLPPANILIGNGSDELLTMITRTFADPGDLVVSPTPTYTLYSTLCEIQGARYATVPYRDDFSLNEDSVPSRAKIVFVANPNSPSGTVLPEETLAAIAAKISGVLVVDEAYVDFARKSCLGLLKSHKNVIILRTLSKSYSLAGLRLGFAFADEAIINNLYKVKDSYNVGRLPIAGAIAALGDMEWVKGNIRKIQAARKRLTWGLEELGFYVYPSESNFVLAEIHSYPAEQIYRQLKRKKILVRYYDTPRLKTCLRISVGTDEEVKRLVIQLAEIISWRPREEQAAEPQQQKSTVIR